MDDQIQPRARGTAEHAAHLTRNRHQATQDALQWLTYDHLPQPLRAFSEPFYETAVNLIGAVHMDSPELTTSLNQLIAAKDSAVRAGIKSTTGRAGSVSRITGTV